MLCQPLMTSLRRGWRLCGRRPSAGWLRAGAALAASLRASSPLRPRCGQAAPCGLAVGSGRCLCSQAAFLLALHPQSTARLRAAAPAGGRPCRGPGLCRPPPCRRALAIAGLAVGGILAWGLVVAGRPCMGGWPWLAAPPARCLHCENAARTLVTRLYNSRVCPGQVTTGDLILCKAKRDGVVKFLTSLHWHRAVLWLLSEGVVVDLRVRIPGLERSQDDPVPVLIRNLPHLSKAPLKPDRLLVVGNALAWELGFEGLIFPHQF
ncbi:hypothetical protein BHM03_00050176 [Ensete ventricosum]|uniref:Uncharacterized protein n=1 Tax=Ensete ventricosum TaxID=4639 RepID=A0A445MLI2_ENSVE|nr:hypothetical protein BHM03_00050176 [Ensete ventricosum]